MDVDNPGGNHPPERRDDNRRREPRKRGRNDSRERYRSRSRDRDRSLDSEGSAPIRRRYDDYPREETSSRNQRPPPLWYNDHIGCIQHDPKSSCTECIRFMGHMSMAIPLAASNPDDNSWEMARFAMKSNNEDRAEITRLTEKCNRLITSLETVETERDNLRAQIEVKNTEWPAWEPPTAERPKEHLRHKAEAPTAAKSTNVSTSTHPTGGQPPPNKGKNVDPSEKGGNKAPPIVTKVDELFQRNVLASWGSIYQRPGEVSKELTGDLNLLIDDEDSDDCDPDFFVLEREREEAKHTAVGKFLQRLPSSTDDDEFKKGRAKGLNPCNRGDWDAIRKYLDNYQDDRVYKYVAERRSALYPIFESKKTRQELSVVQTYIMQNWKTPSWKERPAYNPTTRKRDGPSNTTEQAKTVAAAQDYLEQETRRIGFDSNTQQGRFLISRMGSIGSPNERSHPLVYDAWILTTAKRPLKFRGLVEDPSVPNVLDPRSIRAYLRFSPILRVQGRMFKDNAKLHDLNNNRWTAVMMGVITHPTTYQDELTKNGFMINDRSYEGGVFDEGRHQDFSTTRVVQYMAHRGVRVHEVVDAFPYAMEILKRMQKEGKVSQATENDIGLGLRNPKDLGDAYGTDVVYSFSMKHGRWVSWSKTVPFDEIIVDHTSAPGTAKGSTSSNNDDIEIPAAVPEASSTGNVENDVEIPQIEATAANAAPTSPEDTTMADDNASGSPST